VTPDGREDTRQEDAMFTRRRRIRAMEAADGERSAASVDPREAEGFRLLSSAVRSTLESGTRDAPDFDAMWAGVEARIARPEPAPEAASAGWLAAVMGWKPALVLAPGALVAVAAIVGFLFLSSPQAASNRCYVDSYEAETGSVIVDQDFDDPERPTVIWFVEEG
jgi:hypothetical protein